MLNIYVCEDDSQQARVIEDYIRKYLLVMDYDAELTLSTSNMTELLASVAHKKEAGLFFLDIDLNQKTNGIELAAQIKKIQPNSRIVFVSSHIELVYLTFVYKVEAMDFIPKNSMAELQKKIVECIDVAIERHRDVGLKNENSIVVRNGKIDTVLPIDTIMFFEPSDSVHKIEVHCTNRILDFYSTMNEVESMSDYFIRCHKSLIVNTLCIDSVDYSSRVIKMIDGQERVVSVRNIKKLKDAKRL